MAKQPQKQALNKAQQKTAVVRQEYHYQGAVPPPSILEAYAIQVPNAADRFLTIAEKEQQHRHSAERQHLYCELRFRLFSHITAGTLTVLFLGASLYAALHDHDWYAGVIGGTTLLGIATTFIYSAKMRK